MNDTLRPPSAGRDSRGRFVSPAAPRPASEYAGCSRAAGPAGDTLHNHNPCRHTDAVGLRHWPLVTSPRRPPRSRPGVSCHDDWLQRPPPQWESPALRSAHCVSSHTCHGPWDWGPWPLPQRGFGHGPIDALPRPVQALQVIIDRQGLSPQLGKHPSLDPLGKIVVDRARRA